MGKDIQDYLDKGLYGSPKLKPDEQRKFLGTFRERVVFILSLSELTSSSYENFAISQFQKYPGGTLLVNALLKPAIQKQLIHLTQANNVSLKLVDTENTLLADKAIVVVYTLNHAINKENIELSLQTKFSNAARDIKKTPTTTKSESFFKSLFSKK